MSLQLILMTIFLICLLAFHIWGIVVSIGKLRATIRVEKLAKSYGLDYSIRNKLIMYVFCVLFSWLTYSALSRMQYKSEEDGE